MKLNIRVQFCRLVHNSHSINKLHNKQKNVYNSIAMTGPWASCGNCAMGRGAGAHLAQLLGPGVEYLSCPIFLFSGRKTCSFLPFHTVESGTVFNCRDGIDEEVFGKRRECL